MFILKENIWSTLIDIEPRPTKVIGVLREPGLEYGGGEFGQPTHHHAQGSDLVEVISFIYSTLCCDKKTTI